MSPQFYNYYTEPRYYEPHRSSPSRTEPHRAAPLYIQPYQAAPEPLQAALLFTKPHTRVAPTVTESLQAMADVTIAVRLTFTLHYIYSRSYSRSRECNHQSSRESPTPARAADHVIALIVSQPTTLRTILPMLRRSHRSDNFLPTLRSWQPIHLRHPSSRYEPHQRWVYDHIQASRLSRGIRRRHRSWTTSWVNCLAQTPRQSHRPDPAHQPFYVDHPFAKGCTGCQTTLRQHTRHKHPPLQVPCPEKAMTHSSLSWPISTFPTWKFS